MLYDLYMVLWILKTYVCGPRTVVRDCFGVVDKHTRRARVKQLIIHIHRKLRAGCRPCLRIGEAEDIVCSLCSHSEAQGKPFMRQIDQ